MVKTVTTRMSQGYILVPDAIPDSMLTLQVSRQMLSREEKKIEKIVSGTELWREVRAVGPARQAGMRVWIRHTCPFVSNRLSNLQHHQTPITPPFAHTYSHTPDYNLRPLRISTAVKVLSIFTVSTTSPIYRRCLSHTFLLRASK